MLISFIVRMRFAADDFASSLKRLSLHAENKNKTNKNVQRLRLSFRITAIQTKIKANLYVFIICN